MNDEVDVELSSAYELQKNEIDKLKNIISKKVGGKKITLFTNIDKTLLGGMIIKIGSKMIDNSLKTKLNNLQIVMKGEN